MELLPFYYNVFAAGDSPTSPRFRQELSMREIEMFSPATKRERRSIPDLTPEAETGNLKGLVFSMMLIAYCYV
jgi:hypothetical protein